MRLLLWASFAIGAVLSVIAQVRSEDEPSAIPVVVSRRQSGDIYTTFQQHIHCPADNATYLVNERQCINNHYLFNECLFVVTPVGEFSTPRLRLNIEMAGNSTIAQTINMTNQVVDAVVTFRSREEQVNSSICEISALEVYRGREQATKISHQGFSLSDNSTIKIHLDQLVYRFEEYEGELYRMNLSCSDGVLPEHGCLFFKVFGRTNISEAKFNCSVPGTLPTSSSECPLTTTTPISNYTEEELTTLPLTSDTTQTMTESMTRTPTVTSPSIFAIGSPLFYGIVSLGAAIILVTLCMICMSCVCIVLRCRRKYKRGPKVGATNKGQPAPYEEIQIGSMKMQGYFNNPSFKTDTISPDNTTEQDSMENKYAEIGATYQEIAPRTRDPRQPAWERTSSAVTNTGSEQAPPEYSTLVQVGGHTLRNNLVNSMSDINSEQYAQLMISK